MQTARRLYVYLLTAISLGVLVTGLTMLLRVVFDAVGLGPGRNVLFGDDTMREQLTLAAALTVVSLPVWLAHWIAAERSVDPRRPAIEADAERNSAVRGLYFALVMAVLLVAASASASSLVQWLVLTLVGAEVTGFEFEIRNPAGDLALLLVAGAAWLYHVSLRSRDWGRGPIHGAGAFLPRTYLYLATFVGLMVMLFGIVGLVELAGRVLLGEPTFGAELWWAQPLAGSVAGIAVGGAVWAGHWIFSGRLLADPGWRGASERPAKVRLAFYLAVIVVTAAVALSQLVSSSSAALRALLGVEAGLSAGQTAGLIALPLVSAAIFAAAWWVHRAWLAHEADALGTHERLRTAGRLEDYGTALVGLAFGAGGIAALIGLAIRALFSRSAVIGGEDFIASDLAFGLPTAVLGLAVWIWAWRRVTLRYAETPVDEAASTSRRVMLLIVVAVSLLSGIGSLAFILYRLFGQALGVPSGVDLGTELAAPVGALLVAAVVGLYHAALLRRDQALVRPVPGDAVPAVSTAPPVVAGAAPTVAVVMLRLSGPAGSDVETAALALRASLPEGFVLETLPETTADT